MKKAMIVSTAIVSVAVLVVIVTYWINDSGNLSKYEYLKEPQIIQIQNQKMIEIEFRGDPNTTAGKAFGALYGAFYRLKNNRMKMAAPRARWPIASDIPKKDWLGIFGLPVSESVAGLPGGNQSQLKLTSWEYGIVAEILHVGPYSTETPTIHRLKKFIADHGYQIIGDHEEEYLRGPGFWPTNPKHYYTIIRYRISQK